MQVSGGSQSFNAVNSLRLLGRWMRMFTIPNQSSVAKAFQEFGDAGRMKPSSYYDRVVDVTEELVKFTLLLRDRIPYLVDRYSELTQHAVFYLDPHVCMRCRYRSTELLWQCPHCHDWNTFVEERIAPAQDTTEVEA